jgi:hypothetical protein
MVRGFERANPARVIGISARRDSGAVGALATSLQRFADTGGDALVIRKMLRTQAPGTYAVSATDVIGVACRYCSTPSVPPLTFVVE